VDGLRSGDRAAQSTWVVVTSGGGPIILASLRGSICDIFRDGIAARRGARPAEIEVQFTASAYPAIANWWLDRGAKEAPHQIDEQFRRLASEALERDPTRWGNCGPGGRVAGPTVRSPTAEASRQGARPRQRSARNDPSCVMCEDSVAASPLQRRIAS
jgi:hypothetical protein